MAFGICRQGLVALLVLCSGCVCGGVTQKEQVCQPSAQSVDRNRVALQSLSVYTDRETKHRYGRPLQYVYFKDSDGTIWKVEVGPQDVNTWHVYKQGPDRKYTEVPLETCTEAGRIFPPSDPLKDRAPVTQP